MANDTGYSPQQSSDMYVATGDTCDWAYATKKIFAFTIELTPTSSTGGGFYPGAKVIEKTVNVNTKAAMYLFGMAGKI